MFKRLKDVPESIGDMSGIVFEANIPVRITTNPIARKSVAEYINDINSHNRVCSITLDNTYTISKVIGFGDVFDVEITNDFGEPEEFGSWFFEDVEVN